MYLSAPRSVADILQRLLNAAARLVSGTRKYDRGLSQILHADLHWLDVADQVRYKLAITVHRCLHDKAPKYLADCCVAVSDIASRQRLRSAHHRQLDVPRHQRCTLDRRAFSVAGPIVWNSLPDELRDDIEGCCFMQSLKTLLFSQYYTVSQTVPTYKLFVTLSKFLYCLKVDEICYKTHTTLPASP